MSDWQPAHDEALQKLVGVGGMSARMAAEELNAEFGTDYSRNAVIGRAKRKKIPLKAPQSLLNARAGKESQIALPRPLPVVGTPPKFKRGRKANTTPAQRPDMAIRKAAGGPKLVPASFTARPDPVEPRTVSLLDLTDQTCRWPISTPGAPDFCFCGHPPAEGLPYCEPHCSLAYRAPEPRRQRQ